MRKIKVALSEKGIEQAIKELQRCKREIQRKSELLRVRIAEAIAKDAQNGFSQALVDDLLDGGGRPAEVEVSYTDHGDISVVIASGEDAVWVEFGAGVYANGPAGSSQNPLGSELGFTIGSYGKGHGKQKTWGYYDDNEGLQLTHGTEATMPMYNAMKTVCDSIYAIAKEVFGQ